jgi:hypothetical protein
MRLYTCPLTLKYVQALKLVPVSDTWLGEMHGTRLATLTERAQRAGHSRRLLQLRSFLALEIMATRGLVDIPLASIVKVSKLRWSRSAAGIALLLTTLRTERDELVTLCAEHLFVGSGPVDAIHSMVHDRRTKLIKKYELVESAACLLRRSLRDTEVWTKLGILGENLAEAIEHMSFDARMNIVDELLEQNEESGRRAWETAKLLPM